MRLSVLVLLTSILFLSCSDDSVTNDVKIVDLDPESAQRNADWQSVLESNTCDIIVLETTSESIIGDYSKIFFVGDTVVIGDSETMSVYLFDVNGKYLSKINRVGRSRQEYMNAADFYYKDGFIWILDQSQYKIIQYSLDGNYINSFRYGDGFNFAVLDNEVVINRGWGASYLEKAMLEVRDFKGDLNSFQIKTTPKDAQMYGGNYDHQLIFNVFDNGCDILDPTSGMVYHYENGQTSTKYLIDFGNKALPYKIKRKGLEYMVEKRIAREEYVCNVNRVIETDRYRIISFDYKEGVYYYVFDKSEDKPVWFSRNWHKVEQFGLILGHLYFDGNNVAYLEGAALLRIMAENHKESEYTGKGLELYKLANTLKDDDNAVLIRMKLKGNEK